MQSILSRDISKIPVMETFYTIQGEGFHQGSAAYFIRLGGCDVGCTWCDVKESWDASLYRLYSTEEILKKAKSGENLFTNDTRKDSVGTDPSVSVRFFDPLRTPGSSGDKRIAVITGGEPLLHDCSELTNQLRKAGFSTHLETSGSHPISGEWDWVCLSPKKFKKPLPEILYKADELKVVIFNKSDFEWAEKYALLVPTACKLYLQPEWGKSAIVNPLIIEYIKAHPQWKFSLQLHKYIQVP